MSKILSPNAWYLVAIGAAALAVDGARRLVKRRRAEATRAEDTQGTTDIPMMSFEPTKATSVTDTSAPATPQAKNEPVQAREVSKPAAAKAAPATPDDLTEINGIGPTFAKRLAEAGITTFAEIASSTPDHLREVTRATAVANPEEWIAQARLK